MKKLMIAALLGLTVVPTAAQADPAGSTLCLVASNGGWMLFHVKFCK
jgi:hypothetical protein